LLPAGDLAASSDIFDNIGGRPGFAVTGFDGAIQEIRFCVARN